MHGHGQACVGMRAWALTVIHGPMLWAAKKAVSLACLCATIAFSVPAANIVSSALSTCGCYRSRVWPQAVDILIVLLLLHTSMDVNTFLCYQLMLPLYASLSIM